MQNRAYRSLKAQLRAEAALSSAALALALLTVAGQARAASVTISSSQTTNVATATADDGAPADVTIASGATISVTSGEALSLNSDNTGTLNGAISITDYSNTIGAHLYGGHTGGFTVAGSINLLESTSNSDTDGDDDLDGAFATGSNRIGVLLDGASAYIGQIYMTSDSSISIEGNDSAGIRLSSALTGDFVAAGAISVVGTDSYGVDVDGAVTGGVALNGSISAIGENAVAARIAAPVSGGVSIWGTLTSTGFRYTTAPDDVTDLDADDLLTGGSALRVEASVGSGVLIKGVGVEDDQDDDGDGLIDDVDGDGTVDSDDDSDDDTTATLTSYGSAPTIHITSAESNTAINLGAALNGYGFVNRGSVYAYGVYAGYAATALQVDGLSTAPVTITGGILNDHTIYAQSNDADATGIHIGAYVNAASINNRGTLSAVAVTDLGYTPRAIQLDSGANVQSIINSGSILAQIQGEIGTPTAIQSSSNALTLIQNSGSIVAELTATDDDTDDDVTPVVSGTPVAIDLHAMTSGVKVLQLADTVFTDDDSVNDDADDRPNVEIVGNILFGSGNDTLEASAGTITGDVSFGAGADSLILSGGASLTGALSDSDGQLTIDVQNAALSVSAGTVNLTSLHLGDGGSLKFTLGAGSASSTAFNASGAVSLDSGSSIAPIVTTTIADEGTYVFLRSSALSGASNVLGTISSADSSYLFNYALVTDPSNSNNLALSYQRKTASELGLNRNQAAAYEPMIAAIKTDSAAGDALYGLTSKSDFMQAYNDIMPNFAAAAAEVSMTAIDQMQMASSTRLSARRLGADPADSTWYQEIGYLVNRQADDYGDDYEGWGLGLAAGFDGPLENGWLLGVSLAFTTSEVNNPNRDDDGRQESVISTSMLQANTYLGLQAGQIDVDLLAGAGAGKAKSRRVISIGDSYDATAGADWPVAEFHAAAHAQKTLPLFAGLSAIPRAGLTYMSLWEGDYSESGADALNVNMDQTWTNRLRAETTVELNLASKAGANDIETRIYGGWRADLISDIAERSVSFAGGGGSFTLTDEPLDDGAWVAGFGLRGDVGGTVLSLNYEGEFADHMDRHSLNATLRVLY